MIDLKYFWESLKEALKKAKAAKNSNLAFHNISVDDMQIIVDSLERQVPRKPMLEGDGYAPDGSAVYDEWICPCCNTRYEVDYDEYEYCPNCGQRIDWEELKQYEE